MSDQAKLRVLIADDQALVRSGFRMILNSYPHIEVVGEAATGFEAVAQAVLVHPDVILMDIRMPEMDGIEATRMILADERCKDSRVLILTTFDLDEYVYEALQAGAGGFLLKDTDPEDLVNAVEVIAKGEALLAPSITKRLIAEFVTHRRRSVVNPSAFIDLTEREREVLIEIAHGLSNVEIADALFISQATAKTHIARIMAKLDVHDRSQLVIVAYENGLISPGH